MDAVELTRELIKIESTDPGSWETEIGEYICNYLKESGADTETYEVEPIHRNHTVQHRSSSMQPVTDADAAEYRYPRWW